MRLIALQTRAVITAKALFGSKLTTESELRDMKLMIADRMRNEH